jgi:hypothetical protein
MPKARQQRLFVVDRKTGARRPFGPITRLPDSVQIGALVDYPDSSGKRMTYMFSGQTYFWTGSAWEWGGEILPLLPSELTDTALPKVRKKYLKAKGWI